MNKVKLPSALQGKISDMKFTAVNIGMSGASVYRVSSDTESYYLKIEPVTGELEEEYQKTKWLQKKLEIPSIIYYSKDSSYDYLLLTEIKGNILCDEKYLENPETAVRIIAEGFDKLAGVNIKDCPFDNRLGKKLEKAEENVRLNKVDMSRWEETTKFSSPEVLLDYLHKNRPAEDEIIFTHGDYCLPNIMGNGKRFTGFIDMGRAGIADVWQDIALCIRSLRHNFGTQKYDRLLLEYLGKKLDWNKLEYYILLDEMF